MTEAEWLSGSNPMTMLEWLDGSASDRKFRLYACADCRRIWPWLEGDADGQKAVEVAERFADGTASELELRSAHATPGLLGSYAYQTVAPDAASGAWATASSIADAVGYAVASAEVESATQDVKRAQALLVRDIFGNPFRPVTFAPEWRTDTARALAARMYDARDFSAMPILADALQDAGCDSADILDHCRAPHATHVRGCWVVDLVLGKE